MLRHPADQRLGPLGVVVSGKGGAVEPRLTSLGLGEGPASLLCPLLTPAPARRSLLAAAPVGFTSRLGLQVSLSKDVNSCCIPIRNRDSSAHQL